MSYRLRYTANIDWIGDGSGAMEVSGAQTLSFSATQPVPYVPGADAPTSGNISTACTAMATDIAAQMNAVLGRIQGFATGGG